MLDIKAQGQAFLQVLPFSPVDVFALMLQTCSFVYNRRYMTPEQLIIIKEH